MPLIKNRYGKGRVRVMRIHREGGRHEVSQLNIKAMVEGDALECVSCPGTPIEVLGKPVPGAQPHRYVPSTERARAELGLCQTVSVRDGVMRLARWHQLQPSIA